jgi:hypothetical protein
MTRPSGATCSSPGSISAVEQRLVTSNSAPQRFDAVSSGLKMRKLRCLGVELHHVAHQLALSTCRFGDDLAGLRDLDRIVAKVRHAQVAQQHAAIGVRVGAHAPLALGRQFGQLRDQSALGIE